jgi:hypothetical protein
MNVMLLPHGVFLVAWQRGFIMYHEGRVFYGISDNQAQAMDSAFLLLRDPQTFPDHPHGEA